ncbi:hypothetical protein [Leptolyngbya sp. FACHB-36]|nr:hypothetical protein [Leptolyngbya sp. FACHB-36]
MTTGNIESVYGPVEADTPYTEEEVAEIMGSQDDNDDVTED